MEKSLKNIIEEVIKMKFYELEELNFEDMNVDDKKIYKDNITRMIALESAINETLSPEGKKMFNELDILSGCNIALENNYMFNRGVKTGLNELSFIGEELGTGVIEL